jgi:nucleotide-binding universal stress UspA family protein
MIKDIILYLERNKSRDCVRDYAITVARTFDAHLAGVAFADGANIPLGAFANGANIPVFIISGEMSVGMPPDVIADILAENEKAARSAIERFEAAVKGSLLSVEHRLVEAPASFSEMARRYDLSVVMQSDNKNGVNNDILIEATLFESGRPVIVVPYIQKEGMNLDWIVCCWDGSRAAARAINDALPLLQRARVVELFIVANEKAGNGREIRGVAIGSHLARHGIKVEVVTLPAADIDVANVILSRVADCSASMIVMGGYGHSRLREFILGGATRGVLATMTVPVFISH